MATKKPSRKVLPQDIKPLYGLSAARCNICGNVVFEPKIGEDGFIHIGEMAHNIAYSDNDSAPRAIDGMSGDNTYNNLILLCVLDHKRVDQNTAFYTIENLRTIKSKFEYSIQTKLNGNVRPDKQLVDLINTNFNLQGLIYALSFPLTSLPFNIGDIIDIESFLLEPNRPTSYPFFDTLLNDHMQNVLKYAYQLHPFLMSYYFPSQLNDLRPTNEKPIYPNDQNEITNIVQNLSQAIFKWLEYCRTNYS